jgi:hypothetical protein
MRKLDTKYLGRNIVVALGLEMVHTIRTVLNVEVGSLDVQQMVIATHYILVLG